MATVLDREIDVVSPIAVLHYQEAAGEPIGKIWPEYAISIDDEGDAQIDEGLLLEGLDHAKAIYLVYAVYHQNDDQRPAFGEWAKGLDMNDLFRSFIELVPLMQWTLAPLAARFRRQSPTDSESAA